MTAVIYARYSSDNHREGSIEGQIRECTAYAEKNGITVVKHYIDRAISAKTDNRPEFFDSLVECVLIGQALLLQKQQSLRHGFEVELFRPTLITDTFTLGQLCLNVNQFSDGILLELNLGFALCICVQSCKYCRLIKVVAEMFRSDELRSARGQIA